MSIESPFKNTGFVSAEVSPKQLPKELHRLDKLKVNFLSKGVFFDVYSFEDEEDHVGASGYVVKDFRSGDALGSPEEQVAKFQHQYYEWSQLQKDVGERFFPESYWIRNGDYSDDQAHGFYAKPGETPNTYTDFVKTQLDRQVGDRYSRDDKKKGVFKKMMSSVGALFSTSHAEKPFIGAVIQERVHGVPFSQALMQLDKQDASYTTLQQNVKELIVGLRRFHDENPAGAFTWHGLDSDNVLAEVDEHGKLTGNVSIVDGNFTERPSPAFREMVLKKLEQNVFSKLEEVLKLG